MRLEKERELTEQEMESLEKEWKETHPGDSEAEKPKPPSGTTAPPGATMEQVKAGIIAADVQKIAEASQAREPIASQVAP